MRSAGTIITLVIMLSLTRRIEINFIFIFSAAGIYQFVILNLSQDNINRYLFIIYTLKLVVYKLFSVFDLQVMILAY